MSSNANCPHYERLRPVTTEGPYPPYPIKDLAPEEVEKIAGHAGRPSLARLIRGSPSGFYPLENEPTWTGEAISAEVLSSVDQAPRLTLHELGYMEDDLSVDVGESADSPGIVGPFGLLTGDGTEALHDACTALLAKHGIGSNRDAQVAPIVARRVRHADAQCSLLHQLTQSSGIRAAVERACGVSVIPHPHRYARVQVNYYGAGVDVARWHRDGMNIVLTILLTDHKRHDGGDYLINGRSGLCRVRDCYPSDASIRVVPLRQAGDAIITRGNRVDHCVTPVQSGRRITLAISFYVVGAGRHDANRFSHSTPDDGLFRTLQAWWEFRAPWRTERRLQELSRLV